MREAQGLGDEHVPDRMGARSRRLVSQAFFFGWRPVACFERVPSPYALPGRAQVENWEKQRESGTYPGPVPGEKKGGDHH